MSTMDPEIEQRYEQRRGRFTEAGDDGYGGLFHALNIATKMACDEDTLNDISDAYRHLTGDCIIEDCNLCVCVECGQDHVCYACGTIHQVPGDGDPNCNPAPSGNPDCRLKAMSTAALQPDHLCKKCDRCELCGRRECKGGDDCPQQGAIGTLVDLSTDPK